MRVLGVVIGLLLLGACGPLVPSSAAVAYLMLEGSVVARTGKTMADHTISLTSGKHCSIVRLENGQTYCSEDQVFPKPVVYCYRELAEVTCYERPNPDPSGGPPIGDNSHNLVKGR